MTAIDGRQAVRVEHTASDDGLFPERTRILSYYIDLDSGANGDGETLVVDTLDLSTIDYEAATLTLDRMARTLDITIGEPPASDVVAIYEGGGRPFTVTGGTDAGQPCLTVSPEDVTVCAPAPPPRSTNRIDIEVVAETATFGLAGAEVFRVRLVNVDGADAVSEYLPVPVAGSDASAWALPVAGSNADEIVWYAVDGAELGRARVDEAAEVDAVGDFAPLPIETDGFPASGTPSLLRDVRTAPHEAFERVVFEFDAGDHLEYSLEYVDAAIPPSGEPVQIDGDVILAITMTPAARVDLSGDEPVVSYEGPDRFTPARNDLIREIVLVEDFESVLTWAIGLPDEAQVAAAVLDDPLRLVIDISTTG